MAQIRYKVQISRDTTAVFHVDETKIDEVSMKIGTIIDAISEETMTGIRSDSLSTPNMTEDARKAIKSYWQSRGSRRRQAAIRKLPGFQEFN